MRDSITGSNVVLKKNELLTQETSAESFKTRNPSAALCSNPAKSDESSHSSVFVCERERERERELERVVVGGASTWPVPAFWCCPFLDAIPFLEMIPEKDRHKSATSPRD